MTTTASNIVKSKLLDLLKGTDDKYTETANGALTLKSTGSAVLDFFSRAAAMRQNRKEKNNSNSKNKELVQLFDKALNENLAFSVLSLFYIRDIRGGQGERQIFRDLFAYLAKKQPKLVTELIPLVAEYGRFDDLFSLENSPVVYDMYCYLKEVLLRDVSLYHTTSPANLDKLSISLCAKWMPSENAGKKAKQRAVSLASYLGLHLKEYRVLLSTLRNHLRIVESKMCAKDWQHINYPQVPSKAAFMYRNAFKKHDKDRYEKYLESVKRGEAKINAATLYPYELVEKVVTNCFRHDETIEQLWKSLTDYIGEDHKNSIAVVDTSGSMYGVPITISISLGMYLAERNRHSAWKNHFITFETNPHLIEIKGKTFAERVKNVYNAPWGGSTNLQAVFDLILKTAKDNKLAQKDLPEIVYIISDMQFNTACSVGDKITNLQLLDKKFKAAGYSRPKIVFWNVNTSNQESPASFDDTGVALFSGKSSTVFKAALKGTFNPLSVMVDTLLSERYLPVLHTVINTK